MKLLLILLLFSAPAFAEGELEMFEEICEVTGEVRRGFRLRDIKMQTLSPTSSQLPSVAQSGF